MPTRSRSGSTPRFSRSSSRRVRSPQRSAFVYRRSRAWAASLSFAGDLQHALERGDGFFQPFQRRFGQGADLQAQLALGLRVAARQLRAPDQDLVERLVVAGPAVDPLQRLQRVLVLGDAIQHAPVVVGGRRRVAVAQRDLGDRAVQAQLDGLVEDVGADLAVQRRDVADPLEAGQPFVRVEQRRQLGLRQGVADRQRRRGAGRLLVTERRLLQRRQPHQLLEARARVGLRVDVDADHRRQLGVAAGPLVDRLQRLRRRQPEAAVRRGRHEALQRRDRFLVAGRRLQHLAPAAERLARIAERPFQQRRDRPQQHDAVRVARGLERQAALEDLQPLAVTPLLLVEPRQRLQRLVVLRALVEDADARRDRLVDVADVALEQARDLTPQLLARRRVAGQVDPLAHHLDALPVLRARLEDVIQRVDRRPLLRIDLQDRAQRRDRAVDVAQRLLLQLGDAEQDLLAVLGRRRPPHLHAEDLHQAGDVARLGVQLLQRGRGRRRRVGVLGIEGEDQLPDVDRRAPVAQAPRVQLGRPRQQVGAARDVGRVLLERQLLIDVDQLGEALQHGAEALDLAAARRGCPDRPPAPAARSPAPRRAPAACSPAGRRCAPAAPRRRGPPRPRARRRGSPPGAPRRRSPRRRARGSSRCAGAAPASRPASRASGARPRGSARP